MSSTSPTSTPAQRPTVGLLTAVACISAAVLGFEVALTRVFAALLRYHFGFLVISIALCGLGHLKIVFVLCKSFGVAVAA